MAENWHQLYIQPSAKIYRITIITSQYRITIMGTHIDKYSSSSQNYHRKLVAAFRVQYHKYSILTVTDDNSLVSISES
ncbi:hypothetical protein M758_3G221900 [Ceratodon purpureus]|nr:hypothetical protein M758_3G221900 [Ceratodon purpureus]